MVRGQKLKKLGLHCSDTGPLFFEDVRVPAKNIIGKEGFGFIYQMLQVSITNLRFFILLNELDNF